VEQVKKVLQHGDHVVRKRIVVEVHEIIANLRNFPWARRKQPTIQRPASSVQPSLSQQIEFSRIR
jgi:hypothetical protein